MKKEKTWFEAWMEAVKLAKGQNKLLILLIGWLPALLAEKSPNSNEEKEGEK